MMQSPRETANVPLTEATSSLMDRIEASNKKARNLGLLAILMLIIVIAIGVVGVYKQIGLAQDNQRSAVAARAANASRQKQLQDYIKCLALARFDVPAEQLQTREGTAKALDDCAKQ